jgi:2-(1,2-epoxy-1,2-dihydrophenyl)acetyl-CoA isomerase
VNRARQEIMGSRTLLTAKDGPVVVLTIDRPDAGNAINLELAAALRDAARDAIADPGCAALVLAANGRVFCAGGDLASIAGAGGAGGDLRELVLTLHEAMTLLRESRLVVVAAVAGAAAGAGFALALNADLVVAGESARFLAAYSAVGLTPDTGLTYLLPRVVGAHRATELALLGRTLDARTAREWGIVNEVVADSAVRDRAVELARTIANGPVPAVAETKRLLREGGTNSGADFRRQLDEEARMIVETATSDDARQRIGAFLARVTQPATQAATQPATQAATQAATEPAEGAAR